MYKLYNALQYYVCIMYYVCMYSVYKVDYRGAASP